ncbi:MAG: iron-sulfur cluster assembly accessory protein [Nitrososphaerota archaeon]|nr:iron-sulfur cluster assembly accessory protein [Nitrososphaerota archaeon]
MNETLGLSAPAAAHVRGYLLREGKEDSAIRVAVVRTHCMGGRGYGYNIEEDSAKADDTIVESDGLKLVVDPESLQHLRGARIDYEESLQGGGLVVRNPNAVGQCHCGRHDIFDREALSESGKC